MALKINRIALVSLILSACLAGVAHAVGTHVFGAIKQTLDASTTTVKTGYYLATSLSAVDPDLAAGNITVGRTIFGFVGTYTSDADAVAANILSGHTGYVNGVEISGLMPVRTLSAANDTMAAGSYAATALHSVDTDLVPAVIMPGVNIFGITGSMSVGVNFNLPDTGQTTGVVAAFGEDHDYSSTPMSYTDNGVTVTDNVTGLMWVQSGYGTPYSGSPPYILVGLYYQYTWWDAVKYCDGLDLGGYTDWRLPNFQELVSIVDYGKHGPAINTIFEHTQTSPYWSATPTSSSDAIWLNFDTGAAQPDMMVREQYLRCVRARPLRPCSCSSIRPIRPIRPIFVFSRVLQLAPVGSRSCF